MCRVLGLACYTPSRLAAAAELARAGRRRRTRRSQLPCPGCRIRPVAIGARAWLATPPTAELADALPWFATARRPSAAGRRARLAAVRRGCEELARHLPRPPPSSAARRDRGDLARPSLPNSCRLPARSSRSPSPRLPAQKSSRSPSLASSRVGAAVAWHREACLDAARVWSWS